MSDAIKPYTTLAELPCEQWLIFLAGRDVSNDAREVTTCVLLRMRETARAGIAAQADRERRKATDPNRCEHPYLNRVYVGEGEAINYWECQHCNSEIYVRPNGATGVVYATRADAARGTPTRQDERHNDHLLKAHIDRLNRHCEPLRLILNGLAGRFGQFSEQPPMMGDEVRVALVEAIDHYFELHDFALTLIERHERAFTALSRKQGEELAVGLTARGTTPETGEATCG